MSNTLQFIHSRPGASAHLLHTALTACLEALQQTGQNASEIQLAQAALQELGRIDETERIDLILGRLYQLGYSLEDALFRITFEDFASILLETLDARNQAPDDLSQDALDGIITATCDHLNSTGLDWRAAVHQGIQKGWPK